MCVFNTRVGEVAVGCLSSNVLSGPPEWERIDSWLFNHIAMTAMTDLLLCKCACVSA